MNFKLEEQIFTWTFQKFSACTLKNGDFLKSSGFTAENLYDTTWYVKLYPRGIIRTTKEFISCFLHRSVDSAGPDEVECDYTIEAIYKNNKSLVKYQLLNKFKKGEAYGWRNFIKRSSIIDKNTISSDFTVKVILRKRRSEVVTRKIYLTQFVTDLLSFKRKVKSSTSFCADIKQFSFSEGLQLELIIDGSKDDIEISIRRIKGFTDSHILIGSVILLDLKGGEVDSREAVFEADDPGGTWEFPPFLSLRKITADEDKYLKGDYFTLKFDFAHSSGKTSVSVKDIECSVHDPLVTKKDFSTSLKTDLKHVLTNHVLPDVVLHVGEKEFRAHKVILFARSPVFLAMFNHDMTEIQNNVVNISDVEAETLRSLLEFMYTGYTEIESCESALKLLLADDKYQVSSLKDKGSATLELLLSDENVCDVLFTADLIQQESLKVLAVNHIKDNSIKIFKTDEWKQLADKNLKLATETFCAVSTF